MKNLIYTHRFKLYNFTLILYSENEISEYVYDIYVAPRNLDINRDDLYFEAYQNEEIDLNNGKPDWEEEDDSNDEDNWRNDYPDE